MRGYTSFSLWMSTALARVSFFSHGPYLAEKPMYLVDTVQNLLLLGVS